jgi:drug/metabolite transporter (DMT)-like permease
MADPKPGIARLEVAAAAILFSLGGAGIKACSLTSWQIAAFRSAVAAAMFLVLLPESRRGWTRGTWIVGTGYAATMLLFVIANKLTTSANTIFLQSTAPLYVLLLGPWLLHERNRASDLFVMVLLAAGLCLFFVGHENPWRTAPDPFRGNVLAGIAGVTWALTIMGMRRLGRERHDAPNPAVPAVVAGNVIAVLVALPFALPVPAVRTSDAVILFGLGTVQIGLAYVFLTRALRSVPAFEAMVLLLLEPALNPVWAWLVHGERPGGWAILGGVLILGASGLKTWNDARLAPEIPPA